MKRVLLQVVAAPVLAAFLFGCRTPSVTERWEYKQVNTHLSDSQLNKYAEDGWIVHQMMIGQEQGHTWAYFLLKRRVP